jgi:hypothetical protein
MDAGGYTHPRRDGKSAQRIDSKRVDWMPLRKRACKIKKRKGMNRRIRTVKFGVRRKSGTPPAYVFETI